MTAMDVLMIMSDQHSYKLQGYAGNSLVRTPNLDRLAEEGTALDACYSSCPLCVPARMSMLAGRYASRIGVLNNAACLNQETATFVHSLNALGYDTTLCGRMHFVGADQRHGFTQRLVGDVTGTSHAKARHEKAVGVDALPWNRGRIEQVAIRCMGGGDSTVLNFDRDVTRSAVQYLAKDYERPQFLCVGLYAPHFPYIAPRELFDYYFDKVELPELSFEGDMHPVFEGKLKDTDPETVRGAMAAYYGMTEFLDQNIGKVLEAWDAYLARTGREGVVVYVSDHGDSNGEHGFYGKNTFFEPSVHVPFVIRGADIPAGKRVGSPASLMDLGPTLCEMTGAACPPSQDGKSLLKLIRGEMEDPERIVISEISHRFGARSLGRMAVKGSYKLVTFSGFEGQDQLFDLGADPYETKNVIGEHPEMARELSAALKGLPPAEEVLRGLDLQSANLDLIGNCREPHEEEWHIRNGLAEEPPSPMISTKQPLKF